MKKAFSLVEILLSIIILGIVLLSIISVYSAVSKSLLEPVKINNSKMAANAGFAIVNSYSSKIKPNLKNGWNFNNTIFDKNVFADSIQTINFGYWNYAFYKKDNRVDLYVFGFYDDPKTNSVKVSKIEMFKPTLDPLDSSIIIKSTSYLPKYNMKSVITSWNGDRHWIEKDTKDTLIVSPKIKSYELMDDMIITTEPCYAFNSWIYP